MKIDIETYGGITLATLDGDLDNRAAPLFEERLLPLVRPGCLLVLDMGRVDALTSSGLRLLLLLRRQVGDVGGQAVLACIPELAADIMANTGFLEFFESYDTVSAALAALNGHAEPTRLAAIFDQDGNSGSTNSL